MGLSSIIFSADLESASPVFAALGTDQQFILWSAACTIADKYVGRNLASETATEYYDGALTTFLNLKRWPVTALTEVRYDLSGGFGQVPNSFGTNTILVQGTDYFLDSTRGILQLIRNLSAGFDWFSRGYRTPTSSGRYGRGLVASYIPASWGQVLGSVKVTYTAGLVTATQDLVAAVTEIATYMLRIIDTGGLISSSVSFIDVSESTEVKQMIDQLRGGLPALGTSRMILDNYRTPVVSTGWILG